MSHVHATPVSHLTDPGSHGAGPEIDLDAALSELRAASPLVQCLTNIVAANFTANVLLSAAGGHPWVLDPVAASLPWRGQIALDTLRAANPTIIRGNASEILALAGEASGGRGPDSTDEAHAALASAQQLAAEHHCVVAVSGPIDLITDGKRVVSAANGHPWMTKVTAVGCALGALMAAFAAVCEPLDAAVAATSLLCVAAERAAAESRAPGSFAVALLDQLSLVSPAELAAAAKVHDVEA